VAERRKSILVVDDSEVFLTYISVMLRRMGYDRIMPAAAGREALKLIKLFVPDVVLLDIEMPDSTATLRRIREKEQTAHMPVIMLTTVSEAEARETSRKLKCAGYLTKPVKVTDLNEVINKCITYHGGKKRKYLRTTLEKRVAVTSHGETKGYQAINLSEGGIYLRKTTPLPVGTQVVIDLPLKDDKTLKLRGIVIYTKTITGDIFKVAPGMAVEFQDVSEEDSEILRAYILELLTGDILEEQEEPVIIKNQRIIYF
jgi:CheY-like chemotaxis protein